jgi:hypothetical protein
MNRGVLDGSVSLNVRAVVSNRSIKISASIATTLVEKSNTQDTDLTLPHPPKV